MRINRVAVVYAAFAAALALGGAGQAGAVVIVNDSQIAPFLDKVYSDVLDRSPDPNGKAIWTAALAGGLDTGALATDFLSSPEYNDDLISREFTTLLGRPPTAMDFAAFQGQGQWQIEEAIFTSAEFMSSHPGANAYIESLYQDILGRPAGPTGVAAWSGLYDAGQYAALVDGILTSTEAKTDLVTGYYEDLLDRAPDPPGLNAWVNNGFGTPASVEAGFIGSPEFLADSVAAPAPEPATWAMLLLGCFGLGAVLRSVRVESLAGAGRQLRCGADGRGGVVCSKPPRR
jgi:hypothetical protein